MDQKINILIVEPGKEPRPATVEDTLEAFQQIVGSPIEAGCYLPQRVMLICNGERKNTGRSPPAAQLRGGALRVPYPGPADAVPGVFRPARFGRRRGRVRTRYLLRHLVVPP